MNVLSLIISIVALIIAGLALQRSGGVKDLKKNTAEMLRRLEKKIRDEESGEIK